MHRKYDLPGAQPECISLKYETTGLLGGDAGHGSRARLTFDLNQCTGVFEFEVGGNLGLLSGLSGMSVIAKGDWEIRSLELAIIRLAAYLMDFDADQAHESGDPEVMRAAYILRGAIGAIDQYYNSEEELNVVD